MENHFEKKTGIKVKIINKSLSGHCHLTNSCATDLKVLNSESAKNLPCQGSVSEQLFNAYKQDNEFSKVDLIMCDHNIAMCELYMPFDKPMVLYTTTRYELWRHDQSTWEKLNTNLERIQKKTYNNVIANNLYDANYVNYFTGISVPVMDSFCAYSAEEGTYNPVRKEILIGPSRLSIDKTFFEPLYNLIEKNRTPIILSGIRSLYPTYKYSDLAQHPALVIIPYQLSVMSFFEYYRLNIPLYAPSIEFLTQWHMKYGILNEKTWTRVYTNQPGKGSIIPKHLNSKLKNLDPNDETSYESVKYWNSFADFYQWPHITIYNSWEDLHDKLSTATKEGYMIISQAMRKHNQKLENELVEKWSDIVERAMKQEKRNEKSNKSFEEAMKEGWGITNQC